MLKQMSDAVLLVNPRDGSILYTNEATEQMFEYGKGEMIGLPIKRLNEAYGYQEITSRIEHTIIQRGKWQIEIHHIKKDGTPFRCLAIFSIFTHPLHGEVWMGIYKNISERKKA